MTKILETINCFVWGAPAVVLILSVGLFLSLRLKFVQLALFPEALKSFLSKLCCGEKNSEGITGFQALCTALAATVGTGNLVGVAGAICLGGPGAVFWMWICGFLGMATKFAEVALAVRYRVKSPDGYIGGPMYVISRGLGHRWHSLACLYCWFGIAASFGIGNLAQVNAMVAGINSVFSCFGITQNWMGNLLIGIGLALLVGLTLFGGAGRIGNTAEKLVPFAAAAYILMCTGVLIMKADRIWPAFTSIVQGAFSPRAVTGGMLGSAFQALRIGCSRGVFTNESGMGTAAIAHAGAEVDHPVEQGLMGIMEVFLDTILICTLTALVILVSGVPVSYGKDIGTLLTTAAFAVVYGDYAAVLVAVQLILFAFATILGWGLYGQRCAEFLFGRKSGKLFVLLQTLAVASGSILDTGMIWQFSETMNGLMVIPNLIALAVLAPEIVRLTKDYKKIRQ